VITNGFDPEEIASASDDSLLDPLKHSFVHTGRIGVTGRRLGPVCDAVLRLDREQQDPAKRVELVFAGPLEEGELRQLADPRLEGLVRAVGTLDRPSTLRLQRAADSLLLLTRGVRSEATGKLFEYLAAGRPILVLGDKTEAARIVAETGTGTATSAIDPAAIAQALRQATEAAPTQRGEAALERYSWPVLAARYAELIRSTRA
jgi:glycosyltransferase involved in cell wall biosynthesis